MKTKKKKQHRLGCRMHHLLLRIHGGDGGRPAARFLNDISPRIRDWRRSPAMVWRTRKVITREDGRNEKKFRGGEEGERLGRRGGERESGTTLQSTAAVVSSWKSHRKETPACPRPPTKLNAVRMDTRAQIWRTNSMRTDSIGWMDKYCPHDGV